MPPRTTKSKVLSLFRRCACEGALILLTSPLYLLLVGVVDCKRKNFASSSTPSPKQVAPRIRDNYNPNQGTGSAGIPCRVRISRAPGTQGSSMFISSEIQMAITRYGTSRFELLSEISSGTETGRAHHRGVILHEGDMLQV
jgi:hypothetical protein